MVNPSPPILNPVSSRARLARQDLSPTKRQGTRSGGWTTSVLVCGLVGLSGPALADGIYMTNMQAQLTPASISLLTNPARTPGAQPGDTVEFVLKATVAGVNATGGPAVYFTTYLPSGVDVLGAWFVTDATGSTTRAPGSGGHAHNGWGARGSKTPFGAPFAGVGNARMNDIAGDTGIFYSSDPRTALFTADGSNITKGPTGNPTATGGTSNGYNVTDTFYKAVDAFNLWDADQVNAFGAGGTLGAIPGNPAPTSSAKIINSIGQGATPLGSGSPVAGPQTGYTLDNTGAVGPWQRIQYAGSQIADVSDGIATAVGTADSPTVLDASSLGHSLSDATPLPVGTNAVRWSEGFHLVGDVVYVKVRVRLNASVLSASNGVIMNFESTGSDNWGTGSKDNPWRYFGPTVSSNVNLHISKEIHRVNGQPYGGGNIPAGSTITYRLSYADLGSVPLGNMTITSALPSVIATSGCSTGTPTLSNLSAGVTVTGVSAGTTACPAASATVTFGNLPNVTGGMLGGLRGGTFTYDVKLSASAANGAAIANTATMAGTDLGTNTPKTQTDSANATVGAGQPSLKLDKTGNGPWVVGQAGAAYTLTVTNQGLAATSGVITVLDVLPTGLSAPASFSSGAWSCTTSSQQVTCTSSTSLSSTAGGNTSAIIIPITVGPGAVGAATNQASVGGGNDPFNGGSPPTPGVACSDTNHCARVTTNVTATVAVTVSGTVWIDGDWGKTLSTDEAGSNLGSSALTVYLVDASNLIVAKTSVASDGTFAFDNVASGTYALILSNDPSLAIGTAAPTAGLPPGWANTAETTGDPSSGSSDGNADGRITITVP